MSAMRAAKSSVLLSKYRYSPPVDSFAAAAISSIRASTYPSRPNTSAAASRILLRVWTPFFVVGVAGIVGIEAGSAGEFHRRLGHLGSARRPDKKSDVALLTVAGRSARMAARSEATKARGSPWRPGKVLAIGWLSLSRSW